MPVTVSVTPQSVSLNAGQTQQFTAAVSGTSNPTVTWTLNPAVGTISGGLYRSPASVAATQTVTVTATSAGGTSALSIVTLVPVTVSVTPQSVSLTAGQTQQFTAAVSGTSNTTVTWTLNPAVGTISGGLYSAPASVAATQTVTVTATSACGTSASSIVTLGVYSVSATGPEVSGGLVNINWTAPAGHSANDYLALFPTGTYSRVWLQYTEPPSAAVFLCRSTFRRDHMISAITSTTAVR